MIAIRRHSDRLQDPRLSSAQRDALLAAARHDEHACVVGLDKRLRPVVQAKLPGPNGRARYALQRNGAPTAEALPMAEVWR